MALRASSSHSLYVAAPVALDRRDLGPVHLLSARGGRPGGLHGSIVAFSAREELSATPRLKERGEKGAAGAGKEMSIVTYMKKNKN